MVIGIPVVLLATAVAQSPATRDPAPGPSPAGRAVLREIGRVRARSPFCSGFERHFNGAAHALLAADERVGTIGYTLGTLESHYRARAGELLVYDDRVHLIRFVEDLQASVNEGQRAIDALRGVAPAAESDDDRAATLALASDLQTGLDKQRQLATDSAGVVRALADAQLAAPVGDPHAPLPGGYDDYVVRTPAAERDVRTYLHWDKQVDRIGDAETAAAVRAEALVERCR